MTADPLGEMGSYPYAGANPVGYVDENGLEYRTTVRVIRDLGTEDWAWQEAWQEARDSVGRESVNGGGGGNSGESQVDCGSNPLYFDASVIISLLLGGQEPQPLTPGSLGHALACLYLYKKCLADNGCAPLTLVECQGVWDNCWDQFDQVKFDPSDADYLNEEVPRRNNSGESKDVIPGEYADYER